MHFTMGKKMEVRFIPPKTRNILLYYFQIYSKCNGYLFNIILLISSITSTNDRRLIIIPFILFNTKNDFDRLGKMEIFGHFLQKKMEYLVMFSMIFLLVIHIKQFLLFYDYIDIYKLYMCMVSSYYLNKNNSFKKMRNMYHVGLKFLENIKTSCFIINTRCNTNDNRIIITSKHTSMLTYFLKFFVWLVCFFIVSFLLFR